MSKRNGKPPGKRVSVDIHVRDGDRLETYRGPVVEIKDGKTFHAINESFEAILQESRISAIHGQL